MKYLQFLGKLKDEARKSDIKHKHACIALMRNRAVSPSFHNYMRDCICGIRCGSAHAEMCVMNYILNSLWSERREKQSCIL